MATSEPKPPPIVGRDAALGLAAVACLGAGTTWSSWPLLAAAICLLTALAWRVTRL